jgi:tetratricopeptide (TPR) repeat protein
MNVAAFIWRNRHVFVLVAGAALAWSNAYQGAFLYDDANILNDRRLENPSGFAAHLDGMIRPVANLTFLADRMLWGDDPAGYHLLNALLHLGSGFLVYGIVGRLAPERRAVASWTALLFIVHPIATETVTYISGRPTALMAFFYLAAIHRYVCGHRRTALVPFVLALLSKEIAITLPLALVLVDAVARGQRGAALRDSFWRWHLPFWGLLLAFLGGAALHPRYGYLLDVSLGIRPMLDNLVAQVNVIAYALSLFAWPARLTLIHDIPVVTTALAWPTLGALLLLVIPSAAVLARRNALECFGILWFFLQLLPAHSVLPRVELLSERNLYLAAPGLFLVIVSLACAARERLRGVARYLAHALASGAIAMLIGATILRNALYADPIAFWTDAVAKAPGSSSAHVNLGHAHYLAGDLDAALAQFRAALALDRNNAVAHANFLATWRLRRSRGSDPSLR